MIKRKDLIEKFVRLMRSDDASIFIGSGLSTSCNLPSWAELMKIPFEAVMKIPIDHKLNYDFYDIADKYVQLNGDNRSFLEDILIEHFPTDLGKYSVSNNHRIISRLPITRLWTTNFDLVIEKSLYDQGKKVNVLKSDEDFTHSIIEDVKLFKVHGCISDVGNIVITKEDLFRYYRNYEVMSSALFSSLAENTFLFLGFGFNDDNLKAIIGRLYANYSSNGRPHYAVIKRPKKNKEDEYQFNLMVNDLRKYNIHVLPIDDYSEITLLLKDIEKTYMRGHVFIAGSFIKDMLLKAPDESNYKYRLKEILLTDLEFSNYLKMPQRDDQLFLNEIYNRLDLKKIKEQTETIKEEDWQQTHNEKIFNNFLEEVGRRLYQKDKNIYSGYGEGVSDTLMVGIIKPHTGNGESRLRSNQIKVYPLPTQRHLSDINSLFYRKWILEPCGFMIIARGSTYVSDLISGTFEEYSIVRGMSSVLNGRQRQMLTDFNRLISLDYNELFNYSVNIEHIRKLFEPWDKNLRITAIEINNGKRRNILEGYLAKSLKEQSKTIYYKFCELIGIFDVLINEEWKLIIRLIELVKAQLICYKQIRKHTNPAGIDNDTSDRLNNIIVELNQLTLSRADRFYAQFGYKKSIPMEYDTNRLEPLHEKIRGLKQKATDNKLDKLLGIALLLLSGDYYYLKISHATNDFQKIEIEYTRILLEYEAGKNMIDSGKEAKYRKELEEKLTVKFNEYEDKFADLLDKLVQGAKTYWKNPHTKTKKHIEDIDYRWDDCCKRLSEITFFKERFFKTETKDDIRKEIREFLSGEYEKDMLFMQKYELEEFLSTDKDQQGRRIGRRYLLIYRLQLYKLLHVAADINIGLHRIKNYFSELDLIKQRQENDIVAYGLFRDNTTREDEFTNSNENLEKKKEELFRLITPDDEFIRYNPFIFNPTKIEFYIDLQKKYLEYYQRNGDIHQLMVNIKKVLKYAKRRFDKGGWSGGCIRDDEGLINEYLEDYKKIVEHTKEIFDIDGKRASFKTEIFRSATVVLPVGRFGGMAKKIWESERFRFELLMENRGISDDLCFKLHQHFYNLYTGHDTESGIAGNEEKNQTTIESLFAIIEEFENSPVK